MSNCSDLKSIGKRIRELREGKGLTQEELSKGLNIQREKLAKMETGRQDFKTQDIINVADYFNVSCDYILRGVSAENLDFNKNLGLTEETVKSLLDIKNGFLVEERRMIEIFNKIVPMDYFKLILSQCVLLMDGSNELIRKFSMQSIIKASSIIKIDEIILVDYIKETFGEDAILEAEQQNDKCDLSRYNSWRLFEKILDAFDYRNMIKNIDSSGWLSLLKIDDLKLQGLKARNEQYNSLLSFKKAGD